MKTILLYIGNSMIIDFIVWLVIFGVVGYILKLVFETLGWQSWLKLAWAGLALLALIFFVTRYLGVHLP